ncbi:MAG: signal peptidase I [Elusimicrobiota bacterium]
MEARLFFLSLWCGLYAFLVRFFLKKESTQKNPFFVVVMNAFFWATAGVMVGMLTASYREKVDQADQMAIIFGLVAGLIGAIVGFIVAKKEVKKEALIKDNLEWADTGFSAILLASVVMFFLFQAFKIPSGSMRMTFVEGDHLFVLKCAYGFPIPFTRKKIIPFQQVKRGDIVIFRYPAKSKEDGNYGKDFIKRVIGLEGETLELKNKQLYINGVPLDESYKQHVVNTIYEGNPLPKDEYQMAWENGEFASPSSIDIRDNFGPITIPSGKVFVMGDNRDRSFDSRYWGPLRKDEIKGRAGLRYWPLSRFKLVK